MGQRVSSPRDETARGEQSHLARLVTGRRSSSTTVQSPLQAEVTSSSSSGQMDTDLPNLNGQRSPTRPGPRLRSGRTRLVHSFHSRDEQQTSRNHPRTVFSNEPVSPADVDMADASDRSPSRRDQDRPRSSILPTTASGSLMPRYAEYGSASNGDMREAHGRSIRRRLSNSVSTSPHGIQEIRPRPRTPREQGAPSPERRRRIAAISGPISVTHQPSQAASTETSGNGNLTDSASRRASRFARVRNSLSLPGLVNLLASNPQDMSGSSDVQSQTSDSIPRTPGDEPAIVPAPQLPMPDLGSDFTQPPTRLSPSNRVLRNNEDLRSTLDEVDGIPRLHDQERVSRRFSSLRGLPAHPAPRIRQTEDQAAMLTRLLSVAAAATAASLVGNSDETLSQAQDLGANGVDGSFDSFLQALRNGGLTAALRNSTQTAEDSNEDAARPAEAPAPLNFFRMFRFGAVSSSNRSNRNTRASSNRRERSTNSDGTEQNGSTEPSESRMVPVIIVGIRSVPPNDGEGNPDNNAPPFLDALANLPLTATTNPWANGNGSSNGLLRRSDARSRIAQRRRASMNGSGTFPASYSSQRHQRTTDSPRAHSDAHNHEGAVNADELIDLQLGSNPPSSSPTRTTRSMQAASVAPTFEPSSSSDAASMVDPEPLPAQVSLNEGTSPSPQEESTESSQTMRHRRRLSDSEAARHRNLGSGSSRRNGVVDPDSGSNSGRADGQRSWIIYVLGGSYPEDHPILTTPSLFTDSPTYEDMLLLSSILGPAKPPVATREDVASAPGVYHITNVPGGLLAQAEEGTDSIQIAPGERCLVCLSDYEDEEMVRQLQKCGHLFHRDCIDEWLTTGRNSCPLCRGQGVQDKRGQEQESTSSQNTAAAGQP